MHIKEGSLWRKWDLHLHSPFTQLNDGYKLPTGGDVLDKYCEEIENSDVEVFGITDYFSKKAYDTFIEAFNKKYPKSVKRFFFNLELRLNETVNSQSEEVNIHLIFNPDSLVNADKFLQKLKIVKTGKDGVPLTCAELNTVTDFQSATVTREGIRIAFEETYGKLAVRQNHFLIFTSANNDGIRPQSGKKRKNDICDEIDKISDGFFGSSSNVEHFLKEDRLEEKTEPIAKKPTITGSDAHSFEDITKLLGKYVYEEKDVDGKKQVFRKEITWIKADPTYEGLKQIIYDPIPGERVFITEVKPDQKDEFKVLKRITFPGAKDFPDEIVFNGNLSSIIGSRSSGKSALLAYMAFAVDEADTRSKIRGPGEGEAFHWDKLSAFPYSVEWANGKTTKESPGKVIYLPQNYLFDKSKEPAEVKKKIAPVLFKTNPAFQATYEATNGKIEKANTTIEENVTKWFKTADEAKDIDDELQNFGNKTSIEGAKTGLEKRIEDLKTKNNFANADVQQYQTITEDIAKKEQRTEEINREQQQLVLPQGQTKIFKEVSHNISSDALSIPKKLQEKVNEKLSYEAKTILIELNKIGSEYVTDLGKEKTEIEESIQKIKADNSELIERYKQNQELLKLIEDLNRQKATLGKIASIELLKNDVDKRLKALEKEIKTQMDDRLKLIEELVITKDNEANGIKFDVEYGLDTADIEKLTAKINTRDKSDFIQSGIDLQKVRDDVAKFISSVYSGKQKILQGQNPQDVVKSAFTITEKILFTADMEGDKIGGFKEPTMTSGKRALFSLRLILAESDDQWPLLIDQPEDDLDSRSIYDEIVPFLKRKKKERQIIMVSHNANLVIGADSEQLIIANRNGSDRKNADGKQFNYLTGSLEFTKENDDKCTDTLQAQGVCEHACAILDGGRAAFETRKNKYNFK